MFSLLDSCCILPKSKSQSHAMCLNEQFHLCLCGSAILSGLVSSTRSCRNFIGANTAISFVLIHTSTPHTHHTQPPHTHTQLPHTHSHPPHTTQPPHSPQHTTAVRSVCPCNVVQRTIRCAEQTLPVCFAICFYRKPERVSVS